VFRSILEVATYRTEMVKDVEAAITAGGAQDLKKLLETGALTK
jgi:hypothetical protein